MFLKTFLYLIIFALLHFSYDLAKLEFLKPFGGIDESIFQHLKMAFGSYIIASLIEYSYLKKRFKSFFNFFIPRLFSAITIPWIIFFLLVIILAVISAFLYIKFTYNLPWEEENHPRSNSEGERYHTLTYASTYDRIRNNNLTSNGWSDLRFSSGKISRELKNCVKIINRAINSLGGEK